jgi:hypothetical protein
VLWPYPVATGNRVLEKMFLMLTAFVEKPSNFRVYYFKIIFNCGVLNTKLYLFNWVYF